MIKIGLFSKKAEVRAEEVTTTVDDVLLQALLGRTTISKTEALNIPAVTSCIEFISNIVSSLPIKLYEEKDGEVKEIKDDIRTALLNDDTGDTLNGQQMKKALIEDYLLQGNGYIYINRNMNAVKSLHYVDERYVSINSNCEPIFKAYDVLVNGATYRDFEFIKITRKTKNGGEGVGIIQENEKPLSIAYNTLVFENTLVLTGGNKKGFLKSVEKVTQEIVNSLKDGFKKLYSNNTENVIVLNKGIEFQEASQSSVEMQLNENKKTNAEDLCSLFNLSLDVVSGKCTEEQRNNAIKTAVVPIINAIETALNKDYLLETEKKSKYWAFDTKGLLRASILQRYQAYEIALRTSTMSMNEVRYEEDLPKFDFDYLKMSLADTFLNLKTGQIYTPNTDKTSTIGENKADTIEEVQGEKAQ